jgi:hypothetical protein
MLGLLLAAFLTTTAPSAGTDNDVYVYLGDQAGVCFLDLYTPDPQPYAVYVLSGDYTDVSGVSFRIDGDLFGPEDVLSVTTPPDVSIVGGDVFSGIELAFSSRALDHEPVLYMEVSVHDRIGYVVTEDVSITRGGVTEPVPDFYNSRQVFDCFGAAPSWDPPDTVDVRVDRDETFSFKALVSTNDVPAVTMVTATDSEGWIPEPVEEWIHGSCAWCLWDYTLVTVFVHVPQGVADGTLNPVPFQVTSYFRVIGEKTVVLRAVDPTDTRETTWGRVKALYQ